MAGLNAVAYPTLTTNINTAQEGPYLNPSASTLTSPRSTRKDSGVHDGTLPTINFGDFVSLLNPKNVENCICCNTSLLSSGPPSFLSGKKSEVLRSFCDILNLPYSSGSNPFEDDSDETVEFPFCCYCTSHKIVKLTSIYERLLLQQGHFDKLKEAVMKDILRVFISNMILERKVPLQTVRETRIHDRMFNLFKRHSEKKAGNGAEKGVQTELSSAQFTTSTPTPVPVPRIGHVVEVSCSNTNSNKRRRTTPKKYESYQLERTTNRRPSVNTSQVAQYQYSPAKQANAHLSNIPVSYGESSCAFTDLTSHENVSQFQSVHGASLAHNQPPQPESLPLPVEESNSFENAMNGVMFMLDDNGMLELGENYLPGVDFGQSFDSKENISMNGLPSFDQSTLSDEFHSVLGLMEGLGGDGNFSYEVEIPPVETEVVVARKSSPQMPYAQEEFFPDGENQNQIRMSSYHDQEVRLSSRKIKVQCEVCDKVLSKECLKQHMDQIHGDEKPHKCRGCEKRFARRDHHIQHEERHVINTKRMYFCHRCGNENQDCNISGKSLYIRHCVTKHGIEDDVVEFFYFCDAKDCLESYKIREDYLEHLETHWDSESESSFKCSICEKPFAEQTRLEAHEQEAHQSNEAYYNCQFCHMGFEEENDFSCHILFHKVKIPEERNHTCDICEKSFETHTRLRSHRYNAHNKTKPIRNRKRKLKLESPIQSPSQNNNETGISSPAPESTNKPVMTCDICSREYRCKSSYNKHMRSHKKDKPSIKDNEENSSEVGGITENIVESINDGTSSTDDGNGKHKCTYCTKKLKTTHEFRRHLVARHKDIHLANGVQPCIVCWHVFPDENQLQEHFDEKHIKFKCRVCGKMTANSLMLTQHMARHNGNYPYNCSICGQGFKAESAVKLHFHKCKSTTSKELVKSMARSDSSNFEDEDEDLEELSNTLTPINEAVNELFNSHDPNSYDMLELFQL